MRVVSAICCAALLGGCATSPSNISAAYVSPVTYQSMTCEQIDAELYAVDAKANDLARRIQSRSNADKWYMGVGLIVAWPALLFLSGGKSNEAAEYGQLKGSRDALIGARRSCANSAGSQMTQRGETPGTVHFGKITLVPAATASGMCIIAPANYVGTGAKNAPPITKGMPRCSDLGAY